MSLAAFALAGVALMGLPPGGAFVAKKLLLDAAASSGQWWWGIVLHAGGVFTASYVGLVLAFALRRSVLTPERHGSVSRVAQACALALALGSLLLGWIATVSGLPDALSGAFSLTELGSALIVIGGGALVAAGLALRLPPLSAARTTMFAFARPARRTTVALGRMLVALDWLLRQWAVAGIVLVAVALACGMALLHRN
jgi:NADH:ubiquinone oxidoreductase subunit 5 (subunit L)/multisubunit Na+/H+ antiporter MnhA subunit